MEKTANKQKMHGGKIALYVIAILWTSCYTVSGSSDRNGFLQNKLRDLPEPAEFT